MLVLTLKPGEQIRLDDDVIVVLAKIIDTSKVRLGIEAPSEVLVLREELLSDSSLQGKRGAR